MNPDSSTVLSRVLNLLGIGVVLFYFWRSFLEGAPVWVAVVGSLSIAAWLAAIFLPRRALRSGGALAVVMVVGGSLAAVPTNGLMIVPVAVTIIRVVADRRRPLWFGISLAMIGAVAVAIGVFVTTLPALGLISIEGGLVIAGLVGISRRQYRAAEAQAREMLDEQAHAVALAQRQRVARDIHDVLAHSLGGLVIQLDAAEALLDAGRADDAAAHVHDARALAVSGLTEARRAVGALRDEEQSTPPPDLTVAMDDLVRAHRSLGGTVELAVSGRPHELDGPGTTALSRALQESLTNARKHAPGAPVRVALRWRPHGVELEVENPLGRPGALATTGGGNGLSGMAERFGALPGSDFSAGERIGRFVVTASIGDR